MFVNRGTEKREHKMREQPYWFPAKRYGWGWGPPATWQGWVVLGAFCVLLLVGAFVLLPSCHPAGFIAYTAVLCGLLCAVCYAKGEPPKWRWGRR
jgi:hypothetical protein